MKDLTIVYDGECPLCRNYIRLQKASKNTGSIELVDARKQSPIRQALSDSGFDLDRGMVVRFENRDYAGPDAMTILAHLSERKDVFNRVCFLLFRSNRVSTMLYPLLRGARNLALWVGSIPQINNLKKDTRCQESGDE